jgi:hypothetical protein
MHAHPEVIDIDQMRGGPDDSSQDARRAVVPKMTPYPHASQAAGAAGSDAKAQKVDHRRPPTDWPEYLDREDGDERAKRG